MSLAAVALCAAACAQAPGPPTTTSAPPPTQSVRVTPANIERVRGDSKMSGAVATESLRRITRWGLRERREQLRGALRRKR